MKFSELALAEAVYDERAEMEASGECPGGRKWDTDEEGRRSLTRRIITRMAGSAEQSIIDMWLTFRTASAVDDFGTKKPELIIRLVKVHGPCCFYAHRGLGECSEDVDLDRIIPGSHGGKYTLSNCLLSCSRHNRMRGDKSIEEFLLSGLVREEVPS